jgi:toxin HigB-1
MQLSFASSQLQKQCESTRALQRAHGQACAKKVMTRLADLEAAPTLDEMRNLPGRCHELSGDRAGQLALDLADGKRLVVEPAKDSPPRKKDGGLHWSRVDAVVVVEISNYHGD